MANLPGGAENLRVSLARNSKSSAMKRLEVNLKAISLYDQKEKRRAPDYSQAESGYRKKETKERGA
jgi:hypothetical protein